MGINKVVYNGGTLIDLTGDTVTSNSLLEGYTAHDRTGEIIIGTASGGSEQGNVWQDGEGYVHLDDESGIDLQTKAVTPTESAQTVTPDNGYYALDKVNVGAISSTYVGSGITQRSSSDLTASGATVTVPSGYYSAQASKAVANGTAGTPTASKGTVSNHSISVTPSVTNTTGYITGGTKTGTAVSVSASELVSGTLSVTSSGTKDVTNYASASIPSGTEGTPTATKGTVSNHSISVTPSVTNTTGYIAGGTKSGTAVSVSASELVSGTKSITENGTGIDVTNYASVDVSVSGGSSVSVEPLSVTSNGTYTAPSGTAYSPVIVNVSGGGGDTNPTASKKQINFIDYDGTIRYSYTSSEWANVSALPNNPSHSGLVAQGWNWTKAQIDAQLTALPNGDVWVGQMYITQSGDTEIDVIFPDSARLSPIMTIAVNGTITVDWGDNTTPDTVTGTSLTTRQAVPHTYASVGSYMITIHVVSGSFTFYGTTSYVLLRKNTSAYENRVYANTIQAVRLGSGITSIETYAFYNCYSLASLTIPSGITSIGTYAFSNCHSLASITIPSGVTSIGNNVLYYCYSLASLTIPSGVTSIGNNAFNYCYSLASIAIPSGVTSIGSNAFYNCYSLASLTIPSGVTSIGSTAFNYCYGIAEYHIKPTTPPTLGTNVFQNIVSDCKIYVPSASLEDYQTATNWSTYASYMVGE